MAAQDEIKTPKAADAGSAADKNPRRGDADIRPQGLRRRIDERDRDGCRGYETGAL